MKSIEVQTEQFDFDLCKLELEPGMQLDAMGPPFAIIRNDKLNFNPNVLDHDCPYDYGEELHSQKECLIRQLAHIEAREKGYEAILDFEEMHHGVKPPTSTS